MIQIVEVIGRSEQGQTRPFLCIGDDGRTYYVKGRSAGRRSQLCEWTAGCLAVAAGLPVAPFEIVMVPPALVQARIAHLDLHELGAGAAFGSVKVDSATEFAVGDLSRVPAAIRQQILLFDWWVRNDDRTLTEMGGNPNLLWDVASERVVMIDHNLAFNEGMSGSLFMETHVFGADRATIWPDLAERARWQSRFSSLLPVFDQACDNAPEDWWFEDDSYGVPANFDRRGVRTGLERCVLPEFWKIEL